MDAMTKDGMVTPMVAAAMMAISCHLPFFTAARMPMGIAARSTNTMVIKPSLPETGKPFSMNSFTVLPVYL